MASHASHTFPGRHGANPFGRSPGHSAGSSSGNANKPAGPIHLVAEEDEGDTVTSPTSASFGDNFSSGAPFGGDAANDGPPSAFKPSSEGFPSNYGMGRRTSVSAESMNPTDSSSDKWAAPVHAKTADQLARLKAAVGGHTLFKSL